MSALTAHPITYAMVAWCIYQTVSNATDAEDQMPKGLTKWYPRINPVRNGEYKCDGLEDLQFDIVWK